MQISKITRRSAIALSVAAALTLTGCGDKEPAKSELVPVGIVQLVEHSALDACTKGVKDALAERGYKDGVTSRSTSRTPRATSRICTTSPPASSPTRTS